MGIEIDGSTGMSSAAARYMVGMIATFPATVAPASYIALSGQLVSRVTYAWLWAFAQASGNLAASDGAWTSGQFSPGDGATTFRVPEYRGEFPRFLDSGRGVDAGRVIGVPQADAMQGHIHTVSESGPTATTANPGAAYIGYSGYAPRNSSGPSSDGSNGAPRTAAETRSRNVAMLACIFTGV